MESTGRFCGWAVLLAGALGLGGAASSARAQVRPVTGISAYYDTVDNTNDNYTVAGGGTGDYPAGTNYKINFNSGAQDNLIIRGFETGTNVYNYIQLAQKINIVRVNSSVTGQHNIVFFEENSISGTNVNLKPSLVTTMIDSLRSDLVNRGADNVFANQGDGNGNNNNIERIDYVFNAGFPYYNFTDQRGFLVMDRGGNDRFKIAVILAVNSNGMPTAFSRPVSVLDTEWGSSGITLDTTVMRGYTEGGAPLKPSARTSTQPLSGVFLSWDQFGLTTNDMVYGYSLAGNDVTTNGAYWTQVTNSTYFPTNTTVDSNFGGLDLISGGAMFFDEVLEVGIGDRVWEDYNGDGVQDANEPGLSNVLVHIYTDDDILAATARTDNNGWYFAQGMGPGNYIVQFFPPDGYTFSPQEGSHDAEMDSDPDSLSGITAPYMLSSGQTNLSVDAGFYLTPGNLQLSKSVAPANVNVGEKVVFTLAVTNAGTPSTALIKITDVLPAAFLFSGSGATTGTFSSATGIWDVGALTAGAAAQLSITGTVNVGSGGSQVTNIAAITQMNRPDTNLTDNTASAVFQVQSADLSVTKMADKSAVEEGEAVLFLLSVTNHGPDDVTGVKINDRLPAGLVFSTATPSQGSYNAGTGVWTVGALNNGDSATLQIAASAAAGTGGRFLTNTAVVGASSHEDPVAANNGASAVVMVYGADLSIDKSVDHPAAVEGQVVTYTVVVTNPGPSVATGVRVSEPLTNGLIHSSHEVSQGSYSSGTGVWTIGMIEVNASATLWIHATVAEGTMDTVITNRSRITATDLPDPDSANNEDTATLSISSLTLSKVSDVLLSVHPGEPITYTIVASNAGSRTHANVTLSDWVPNGTTYVPGSLNVFRYPTISTTVVYTSSSSFLVPAGVTSITVEAWGGGAGGGRARGNPSTGGGGAGGAYALKTIAVTPLQNYTVTVGAGGIGGNGTGTDTQHGRPGDPSWFGSVNTLFAEGGARGLSAGNVNNSNGDPGLGSYAASIGDTINRGGNGSLGNYTSGSGYSGAGGGGAGTTGNGGHAAAGTGGAGASLYGGKGANGVGNSTAGANGAAYGGGGSGGKANNSTDRNGGNGENGLVRISYGTSGTVSDPPDLATGWSLDPGQKLQATFSVLVDDPLATLAITNTAAVSSAQQIVPVVATVVDRVIYTDLAITKTANTSALEEGQNVVFTLTVTNGSAQAAASGVVVNDLIPAGFNFGSASPSQGAYNPATGVWTVGTLSASSAATLAMTVTAAAGGGGFWWTNTAAITAYDQVDPELSNNTAQAVVLVKGADLGLTKTVDNPTPNETSQVVYTIRLTNSGPSDVAGVAVSEPLTNGLAYVSHSVSQGSYSTNTGLWSVGTLANGNGAILTLTAEVELGTFGTVLTNRSRISAAGLPDPVYANNQDEATIVVSGLKVAKISDVVGHASPGDIITYSISVSNLSSVTHTGVRISDTLPTGTVYVAGSLAVSQTPANPATTNVYTNSTTFAPPPGVTSVTVEAWGGGGGGGMALGNPSTGGGGAGGSYAKKTVAVSAGQNYTVTVGDGGRGGLASTTNGLSGSNSWFNTVSTVFAQGGARGMGTATVNNNAAAGAGSSSLCVGTVVYRGGNGSTGRYAATVGNFSGSGGGGAGSTGNGGDATIHGLGGVGTLLFGGTGADGVTNNRPGTSASVYGGGGSGGKANTTTDQPGGAGAAGLVQISYVPRGNTNAPPDLVSDWTLAAGSTLTATFQVLVVNPGSVTQLLNTASVTCDQQPTPVTASVADLVLHTDLGLSKVVNDTHPDEGETVVYTLVVTNQGPSSAGSILVSDLLATGLTYASHTAGQGTYNRISGIWSVGTLATGSSAQLQISAIVNAGTSGRAITNQAGISASDKADLNQGDNFASVVISVVSVDIGVGKSATPTVPVESGLLVYSVTVTNFGPDAATGVKVTDVLPAGLDFLSYDAGQGSYNSISGIWSVGTLAPMATARLTINALVQIHTAGTKITNAASLTAVDQIDSNSGNNRAQVVVNPSEALLDLTKTAKPAGPVWAGDVITYTLAVTNRSGEMQHNVTLTDPLPAGAVYVADSCQVNAPATITETFGDQFSRRVYSNNDGSEMWASDWVEAESNGPTAGSIQIQFDNGVDETYTLRFTGGSQSIRRTANLFGYTSAMLEFDYQRIGLDTTNEYVAIQASTNGVSGWTELGRFRGSTNDADYIHFSANISAFISTGTTIRLISPAGMDGTDIVWIDNVLITGTRRTNLTVPGNPPPNLASGITLEPNEALSIQFEVWVDNPALYPQIVNQASLTSTEMPDPQMDTAVTPVDACFTIAPTGLHADPTNVTSFVARWTEVDGCFGYRLDVATDPAFGAADYVSDYSNRFVAGTFQPVTGLMPNTLFYFRVRAEWDSVCTSADSNPAAVETLGLPTIGVFPERLDFGTVDAHGSSNLVVTVTNSGTAELEIDSIEFSGGGSTYFTVWPATASIPAGGSIECTVTYAPIAGGVHDLVLILHNNSTDYSDLEIPTRGECYDPAAELPELLAFQVTDDAGLTNEVTDQSLGSGIATAKFIAYHFAGITTTGGSFDLIYPEGAIALSNAPFESIEPVTVGGRAAQEISAAIPHFFPAVLGRYGMRVTVASSNGMWLTAETNFTSVAAGSAVPMALDNFGRSDVADDIGEGWLSILTGPITGNIQIRNRVLQLYGPGGTGGAHGRVSIARNMSSRYDPVWTNNAGVMTWAFNFYSGREPQTGFAPGAYGAAFVLGSDSIDWVTGIGNGYAVRICSNQVALASFAGGLNLDSDWTTIGQPATLGSAKSAVAVLVDLEIETGRWRLYVRESPGSGVGAFANPLQDMGDHLVSQTTNTVHRQRSLPYVGCYWNHGNAPADTNAAAFFDDLYAPYVLRDSEPMQFSAIDNDIMLPTTLGNVRVNEESVPEEVPGRLDVVWTNAPEFVVTFDPLATDQDPGYSTRSIQRDVRGIGEYRVSPDPVNVLSASNRGVRGFPFPVVTTNGALANYGFEMITVGGDWKMDSHCFYQTKSADASRVYEGSNSLRQTEGGVAFQTFEFRNASGVTPQIALSGWYRGGPADVIVTAYATNDLVNPTDTARISPGQAVGWTPFSLPKQALGDANTEFLRVSLAATGGETFWDNLRFTVDIGTNRSSMRFRAGAENQGLVPQYIYAVDADYNRGGDRLGGLTKFFYIPFDMTPPTPVNMPIGGNGASTETVDDPTTQFDLEWSTNGLGPDNPASPLHPTKKAEDIDILSQWHSYQIYYGTYDSKNVPLDDDATSTNGYVYKTYVQNGAFRSWSRINPETPIADPTAPGYQPTYQAMTNLGTSHLRLYDLDYDQEYVVVVVGVDKAGNVGDAGVQSWSTNSTIRFALIRGEVIDKSAARAAFPTAKLDNTNTPTAAALHWIASGPTNEQGVYTAVSKDYDLISWDSTRFQESSNNQWKLVDTVRSNWFVDDGGQAKPRGQMRFYRASYKDRWRATNALGRLQRKLASEEVYAMHNVVLSGDQNFVALHGTPYVNTFAGVFGGLETFPGGASALPDAGATLVEFYSASTNTVTSDQYWLSSSGRWIQVGGLDVTTNWMGSDFFSRGFSITLPNPLPTNYVTTTAWDYNQVDEEGHPIHVPAMIWSPIVQVPTNGFSQVINTGSRSGRIAKLVFNVAALRLPVPAHPSQMNLRESGFVNGTRGLSDEIYTINTETKTVRNGSTIYCDVNGIWRFVADDSLVPANYFRPNDMIVIVSQNWAGNGSWTWTYNPAQFYTLPSRWMGD